MLKQIKLSLAVIGAVAVASTGAMVKAATQTITTDVDFATAISFESVTNIDFGYVSNGASGRVLNIDTTGSIGGADSGDHISGGTAGSVNIVGSATQTIDISAGTYTANGNVTPSLARGAYNGGAESDLDAGLTSQAAPGASPGNAILLGVTITTNAVHADGASAAPTFVLTVDYS